MAVGIGSNIASLNAQRRLGDATTELSSAYERLSSGQRINRGSDDAAGLALAKALGTNAKVYGQAIRNVNDGISLLSIAESSIGELKNIVIRQREIATQAANGSYSSAQRAALDTELTQLSSEYNRIIDTTSFNGRTLFSNTEGSLSLQAGYGAEGAIAAEFRSTEGVTQNDIRSSSLGSTGSEGDDSSHDPKLSADGRYVAFLSDATNLVAGDTNGTSDVFIKDLLTGEIKRVSTDTAGTQGDGDCFSPSISADGRYVAFQTLATNLVAGDTNGTADVFVKDLLTGETRMVSTDTAGTQGDVMSYAPSVSADGRYVAFQSDATNLVAGDTNAASDIFIKDLVTGETIRVSLDTAGTEGDGGSYTPSISADGKYVTFDSDASNLVTGDANGFRDVFIKNLVTGETRMVSSDAAGTEGDNMSYAASISADGRYVAFNSSASNLTAGDTNGKTDIFIKDLLTGQITIASTDTAGTQTDNHSYSPSISASGRYVAYYSRATNLVAGDTNGVRDVFIKDIVTGETRRVTSDTAGVQGNGDSFYPSISADGRYVAFQSDASNIVAGDTNGVGDVFMTGNPFVGEWKIARNEWLSVKTQNDALATQTRLDQYMNELGTVSGTIGALVSRFDKTLSNLSSLRECSLTAESRITDADVGQEAANLTRNQIVQQAATAILAQANQQPQVSLQLLKGLA